VTKTPFPLPIVKFPRRDSSGHRIADLMGRQPRQTRDLPMWYWPFELVLRLLARRLARHPIEFYGTGLLPASASPQMITDDIALNMAANVLDAMDHTEAAAGLRLLLPEAEGRVNGQPYQEQVGKWGTRAEPSADDNSAR